MGAAGPERRRQLLDEAIDANEQLLERLDDTLSRIGAFRDERAAKAVASARLDGSSTPTDGRGTPRGVRRPTDGGTTSQERPTPGHQQERQTTKESPPMNEAMRAETVEIVGHGGDPIEAYLAQPLDGAATGGVVVIHHMPGYDEATKEITRKFAAHGYLAVCPNLYYREAPGASPDDAAATARAQGGVPDDAAGGRRGRGGRPPSVPGLLQRQGGHHRVLLRRPAVVPRRLQPRARCRRRLLRRLRPRVATRRLPAQGRAAGHRVPDLSLPAARPVRRRGPVPGARRGGRARGAAHRAGKEFEFHTYEGAGHAFFATDRPSYRPEAAVDGWQRIWDFFGRHLSQG